VAALDPCSTLAVVGARLLTVARDERVAGATLEAVSSSGVRPPSLHAASSIRAAATNAASSHLPEPLIDEILIDEIPGLVMLASRFSM
jgi:hypothetical protein